MKKHIVIPLVCIVVWATAYVVFSNRSLNIAYHSYQMKRNYDTTFGTTEDLGGGFSGFRLGDSYDAYERHRDSLVELGALDENNYVLNYLIPGTEERRHFFGLICEGRCPGNIEVVGGSEEIDKPWPLTVWCWPKDTPEWDGYIKKRDTRSYTVEFMEKSSSSSETYMRTTR